MAEFIDPAIVPKVTLPSGEEVPCMGMGTFGSDRVTAFKNYPQAHEKFCSTSQPLAVRFG